jgi:hypothetical protein
MEAKVSRPVLRGPGPSNGASLLGELDALEIDRTSCTSFWANRFRVRLIAAAYVLMQELGLRAAGHEPQPGECDCQLGGDATTSEGWQFPPAGGEVVP